MINLLFYFRKLRQKRKNGFAMIETLILIIVVAFTVGAILQTAYVTSTMQITGRKYVVSHKSMVSFFHTLESVEAGAIISGDVFNLVRDIDAVGNYANIETPVVSYDDKLVYVRIVLTDTDRSRREMNSTYNIFSNRTVSDDRYKSRG